MKETILIAATLTSVFLIVYHHIGYPLILRMIYKRRRRTDAKLLVTARHYETSGADGELPSVCIIVPAFNEVRWIAEKIRNLAVLDYPQSRFSVMIACDGCTDDTAEIARATAAETLCTDLNIDIIEFEDNRGKVALVNELLDLTDADVVALTDVSALVSVDALTIAAAYFRSPDVGVLNSNYRLFTPGSTGEDTYWWYQSRIKTSEATLGATLGAHGAFYMFRRALFTPLPGDTINDDFILPMEIVSRGYRAEHEPRITALELEKSDNRTDYRRRRRIGAGNMQQLIRLRHLLLPRHGGVAFSFASGKALRTLVPGLMVIALFGSLSLAGSYRFFAILSALQLTAYALAAWPLVMKPKRTHRLIKTLAYLVSGHIAGLIGGTRYLLGMEKGPWKKVTPSLLQTVPEDHSIDTLRHINPLTAHGKRLFDVLVSGAALLLTMPLFPMIAMAIRLESDGPVLFRQTRIGKAFPDRVAIFEIIKFRTMVNDAEEHSGATWAKKHDPRITRVGHFLRKTRLDELPQLVNVLRGDMSMIGPRPERPGFYARLEQAIPFFAERTHGVTPGITGLAQVNQGYDTCIDDVRSKVGFDHRYALALAAPLAWLKMDMSIIARTLYVMATGRGQ